MYKLLIIDDEPLVQVGLKSMLDWEKLDIELIGSASNGNQALDLIEKYHPEIALCDIKMPQCSGLDLLKICRQKDPHLPLFIFLTSYDEFSLIKEAMNFQAFDYLLKLELNQQVLNDCLLKAKEFLNRILITTKSPKISHQLFFEKFMVRLLNNLFENRSQYIRQREALGINFQAKQYRVVLVHIHCDPMQATADEEEQLRRSMSIVDMSKKMIEKSIPCFTFSLDPERFCILLCPIHDSSTDDINILRSMLEDVQRMISNYFNVSLSMALGRFCKDLFYLHESYQDARQVLIYCRPKNPIIFYDDEAINLQEHNTFNLGIFKNSIRLAFENYDPDSLETTINSLLELFDDYPTMYFQTMDAACSLLHLTLSLLPESQSTLASIYADEVEGYRSLYRQNTTQGVLNWLVRFKKGICQHLRCHHKTYKNHMILNIRNYLDEHICDKLTLNDIASLFSISPNYLSQLFKKNMDMGFNEYITSKKIAIAKQRLLDSNMKIYEIAEELGFESAFYFSKVFKKVEGCPPRKYLSQHQHS